MANADSQSLFTSVKTTGDDHICLTDSNEDKETESILVHNNVVIHCVVRKRF